MSICTLSRVKDLQLPDFLFLNATVPEVRYSWVPFSTSSLAFSDVGFMHSFVFMFLITVVPFPVSPIALPPIDRFSV